MADHNKEVDKVTGVETTGHEWDGLKELNNPLPKWWLYMFYASIVWSIGYWVLMPSWPLISSYTTGMLGTSQRAEATAEYAAAQTARAKTGEQLVEASLEEIQTTPKLLEYAMAQGKVAFGDNCAPCHGVAATGAIGYPNLQDDAWIWGGSLDDIAYTINYGIRSGNDDERYAEMSAFGRDEILSEEEIDQVSNYVAKLAGLQPEEGVDLSAGKVVYEDNCAACHGDDARGMRDTGAPDLTAPNYLFGRSLDAIKAQVNAPRHGVMPAWVDRLDPATVKSLAVYVHALGGGE
ncbi:cytochrome-c oxidase, cbb3-type subunit III [Polycladidibacter hongkongensis]|uniref:cytochrome-c oxidase, cbb3-type subunit III n=1 Tax=Polycladidibacter hongkongensis TaxID=1647556 RepID=UPI00082F5DEA|nr:cytochrome-c oxidase, cbb3-type subunit III [Pseudovibrio hongkongensis]